MAETGKKKLADYFASDRTVILQSTDKRQALAELIALACRDIASDLEPQQVLDAVWRREETLSTRLAPGIAIPHARIVTMQTTLVTVGKSNKGISWEEEGEELPVRIVILILGGDQEHLHVLSRIATRLSNDELCRQLLEVQDACKLHELLTLPYPRTTVIPEPDMQALSFVCFEQALAMAVKMAATKIILHVDAIGELSFVENYQLDEIELLVVTRDASRYAPCRQKHRFLSVPFRGLSRSNQMDVAFLFLISQGLLRRNERVVSVCGIPDSGLLDTVMLTNLEQEYRNLFAGQSEIGLPADIEPQVLSRILQVASNLANEGREGKSVGTMFVVGDYEQVKKYCRQMVINPFKGYTEMERNILDPGLEETVKEFSRIDGAFVLRGDGVLMSAGTFLRADAEVAKLASGLGARHAAAAMISHQTQALSVALSESTRKISLFHNGDVTLEI